MTWQVMLLMLPLSHFSHIRLCVTPQTAAYQAHLSLGFSRQEHWGGLPFPSPGRLYCIPNTQSHLRCCGLTFCTKRLETSPVPESVLKVQHAQIPVPRNGQKQREKVRNEVCPPLIPSSVPLSLPPFCNIVYFPQYKHNLCSLYKLFEIQKYITKTQSKLTTSQTSPQSLLIFQAIPSYSFSAQFCDQKYIFVCLNIACIELLPQDKFSEK